MQNGIENINKLRDKYSVLSFYTVNDMRFICDKIEKNLVSGQGRNKQALLTNLVNKLSWLFLDQMQQAKLEETKTMDVVIDEYNDKHWFV